MPSLESGEVTRAIESSFKPDKHKGLRGPISVDPFFEKDLAKIDSRLALRWNPFHGLYMVWMKMSSDRLWSQPTHVIHDGRWGFRTPGPRDLRVLKVANHMAQKLDYRAREAAAEKNDDIELEKARYSRQVAMQEMTQQVAKKFDLTAGKMFDGDFAITRGAIGHDRSKMLETV